MTVRRATTRTEPSAHRFLAAALPPASAWIMTQLVGRFVDDAVPRDSCERSPGLSARSFVIPLTLQEGPTFAGM